MTIPSYLLNTPGYCPGRYCGRTVLENGNLSDCGPCPRGFYKNSSFLCIPCEDFITQYDWLYLGFMVLLILVLHFFFIDMVSMRRSFTKEVLILHLTAFIEVIVASFLTLILTDPIGSLNVRSCKNRSPADFYTMFHNPNVLYEKVINCTQEAVYPLQTMVLMLHALVLLIMLIIRPWICARCLPRQSKMSVYAAMYFLPVLTILHTIGGGAFYYSFPMITLILTATSSAAHFAIRLDQNWKKLIMNTITDTRNAIILLGHWGLLAFGIYSMLCLKDIHINPFIIAACVPIPASFYIATVQFTDPSKLL